MYTKYKVLRTYNWDTCSHIYTYKLHLKHVGKFVQYKTQIQPVIVVNYKLIE